MRLGLDYSFSAPIGPSIHKSVGSTFAVRYLTGDAPKRLSAGEVHDLRWHGISIVGVFETTANRALDGHGAGVADAKLAELHGHELGMSKERPIYFAVDFDATEAQQAVINDYLQGVNDVIGVHRAGIYGGYGPCKRAADAGRVGYIYQTYAWSGGKVDHRTNLYQFSNGHTVAGKSVDYNKALKTDFGQWDFVGPKPKDPKGQWDFKGHVDMDTGRWHIEGTKGKNAEMGEHARRWAAKLSVGEEHGDWKISDLPFES